MYSGEYDACDVTLSVYPHLCAVTGNKLNQFDFDVYESRDKSFIN
jgi:hypothetical protein